MVAFPKIPQPHSLAREIKYRTGQSVIMLCWLIEELFVLCAFFIAAMWDTCVRGKDAEEQLKTR